MEEKRSLKKIVLFGAVIFIAFAITFPAMGEETYSLYKMTGTIAAIDLDYNTVVVDVTLAHGKTFVVGGPIAKGAILMKGGRIVSLADFHIGERVVVKWAPTNQGHLIRMMKSM